MTKNHWEAFFDAHAPYYMDNVFVKNTVAEVDFIVEELQLQPGSTVLDIGCGAGRHAVELARRRYDVTGVDISGGCSGRRGPRRRQLAWTWSGCRRTR